MIPLYDIIVFLSLGGFFPAGDLVVVVVVVVLVAIIIVVIIIVVKVISWFKGSGLRATV